MGRLRQITVRLLVGLLVAAVFLLLLEGGLHLLPLDRWERERGPNLSNPLFVPGEGAYADKFVTNRHFQGAINFQSFAKVKPPGVKRVFVLGGSAALGWPGPNSSSFSGYIQRTLEKDVPGTYEIINVAAMSYGSHRVLDFLSDVVAMQPDVIIIWCGNNEYIERNGLSPLARSAAMGKVQRLLRHSSLYSSLRLVLQSTVPALFARSPEADMTDPRNTPLVRRGMMGRSPEIDRQVLENYRANLQSMARLIKMSGATGIFCTVPVNISGWEPTSANPEFDSPEQRVQWEALQQQSFSLYYQNRFTEAVPLLRQLVEVSPRYALGHYFLGVSYQRLGKSEEALKAFNLARDLDLRPMRALTSFDETVRKVAATEGMGLVDLEKDFIATSGPSLSGLDLFLDYVHPTETGNKLAAVLVLAEMLRDNSARMFLLAQMIRDDDWVSRNFNWKFSYYYAIGMTCQNNGDLVGAEQAYLAVLKEDPNSSDAAGNLGVIYKQRGDLSAARKYYEQAIRLDPGSIFAADLAGILYLQGDRAGAREMGKRVIGQGVVNIGLLVLLGDMEFEEGRNLSAIDYYQKAIDAGGGLGTFEKIGNSYRRMGDEIHAQEAFARAKGDR